MESLSALCEKYIEWKHHFSSDGLSITLLQRVSRVVFQQRRAGKSIVFDVLRVSKRVPTASNDKRAPKLTEQALKAITLKG
jgi:hypothetical protein